MFVIEVGIAKGLRKGKSDGIPWIAGIALKLYGVVVKVVVVGIFGIDAGRFFLEGFSECSLYFDVYTSR